MKNSYERDASIHNKEYFILVFTRSEFLLPFGLTAIIACFGIALSLPGNTFATSITYAGIAEIMPEHYWAGACFLISALSVIFWMSGKFVLILAQHCMLMTWHGFLALSFLQSNGITTASGTYAVLALLATLRGLHVTVLGPNPPSRIQHSANLRHHAHGKRKDSGGDHVPLHVSAKSGYGENVEGGE